MHHVGSFVWSVVRIWLD